MLPKKLAQFVASTTETTVYTVPASNYTMLKEIVVANTSGSTQTLSLSLVPVGNTASFVNRILPSVPLAPNAVAVFNFSTVMATGDFLSVLASASGSITVTISGLEDPGTGTSSGTSNFASTGMVVTSGTRPPSPYEGMVIYETDTDRMMIWDGTYWKPNKPVFDTPYTTPGGTTSGTSILTAGTVAVSSYTYPTRQRATAWMMLTGTVAADEYDVVIENSVSGAGTTLRGARYVVATGTKLQMCMPEGVWYDVAANIAVNWWLKMARLGGSGTATITGDPRYSAFIVEVVPN